MVDSFPGSLEQFLDGAAESWQRPRRRDFFEFFERWRQSFDGQLASGPPSVRGLDAMDEMDARLPADVVLFREPAYPHLPSGTTGPAFAFEVRRLRSIDRDLFNALDVTVADAAGRFCCLYTHEIGALADPWFVEIQGRGVRGR